MSFVDQVHPEAVLALGYSFFLLLVALGIEIVARFSHRRLRYSKAVGFRFHPQARAWQCPQGHFLWLYEVDQQSRLVRYRAEAHHCNRCDIKHTCTDSDEGRELAHSFEGWAESEMGRFHRGFCLMLIVLAGFVLAVALARHLHGGIEPQVLAITLMLDIAVGWRVWGRLLQPEGNEISMPSVPSASDSSPTFRIVQNYSRRRP